MATVKSLVVAWWWWWGSNGGWWWWWGWLVYNASFSVTAQAYTITVGTGGTWATWNQYWGMWLDSVFSTITANWWWWAGSGFYAKAWLNWGCWWWWGMGDVGSISAGTGTQWFGWWISRVQNPPALWWWWWGMWWVWEAWTGTAWTWDWGIWASYDISWTSLYYAAGWGWGWFNLTWGTWGSSIWGNGWTYSPATNWTNGSANRGSWGGWWWAWGGVGWNGSAWVVVISYKTDWTDWVDASSAWDANATKTQSWWYDIWTFTQSGTWTMVSAATTAIKSINWLAYSSIKSINWLAIASVKSFNWLA